MSFVYRCSLRCRGGGARFGTCRRRCYSYFQWWWCRIFLLSLFFRRGSVWGEVSDVSLLVVLRRVVRREASEVEEVVMRNLSCLS